MQEEFYSNRFLQGTVLRPVMRSVGLTLGIVLLTVMGGEILGFVAVWLMGERLGAGIAFWIGCGTGGILGVLGLIACWAQHARIIGARSYLAAGLPLASAEGPAVFSGGRKRHRGSYPPTKLEIGGRSFDLRDCACRRDLTTVANYQFVHSKDDPKGRIVGLSVGTPFRVWYTPSQIIVRAEIDIPEAYLDTERRSAFLMNEFRDDPERLQRLRTIEEAKKRLKERGPLPPDVQAKVDRWEAEVRKLNPRLPRGN